jgi:hypothetical protein
LDPPLFRSQADHLPKFDQVRFSPLNYLKEVVIHHIVPLRFLSTIHSNVSRQFIRLSTEDLNCIVRALA